MNSPEPNPVNPAVRVDNLSVTFSDIRVLDRVSLQIPVGRMVALIGPNGSGKTTLLRCLLGLQKPDSGTVRLFDLPIGKALPRVGYVPQRLAFDRSFTLSVREFLSLRLRKTRHWFFKKPKALDQELEQILGELNLHPLLHRPVARLSGGQLQRVLIAFSMLHDPELLLLDEPTAGVDHPGEQDFYELIAEFHKRHQITIVLVSHDLSMVHRHATWVYALNQKICCEGPPEDIMNAESLKRAYGIHVTPYHHHHHAH